MVRALGDRLRGHARAVLENSLLHIQAHLVSRCGLQEVGHHAGVPRRGLPPPSALLGARIRRAQTACIAALGASSVLVRPLAARRICCSEPVPGAYQPPRKTSTCSGPWTQLLLLFRIPSSWKSGIKAFGFWSGVSCNSGPISMVFWPLNA